jgi:ABC-2 type transport system ATP-binding protein
LVSSHDVDEVERLADWVGFLSGGRLLFAEPVASLLARFRQVEVVADGGAPALPRNDGWIEEGRAGRMLRFVETSYQQDVGDARIAAAFPGTTVRTTPLALREIFVTVARTVARSEAA